MYKKQRPNKTTLSINDSYVGETIEQKVQRIMSNKEPLTDGATLIYTERKDGVQPAYNIRTDRFDVAIEAMDKLAKAHTARRENKPTLGEQAKEGMKKEINTTANENKSK